MSARRLGRRGRLAFGGVAVVAALALVAVGTQSWAARGGHHRPVRTATPIRHVVVIFGENVSFDHYFGTYPRAANTDGTSFHAKRGTPRVDGLTRRLLTDNPNRYNPRRLSHEHALTCDQNHGYGAEQKAYHDGRADRFVENTSVDTCTGQPILYGEPGLGMDYYDGNTVTAMWNYAQRYAMSDNSYNTVYGPSTPGALNLVSGQTHGFHAVDPVTGEPVDDAYAIQSPDAHGVGTVINDPDPAFDDCSDANHTADEPLAVGTGRNVGDLLNDRGVTWGWFQGGFRPTGHANGYAVCGATHRNIGGNEVVDYSPHHEPFQYYESTANPKHLPPSSVSAIGHTDQANHQYDLADFDAALEAGNLPAVSFLKAAEYQDGHAGYSDPLDEQRFVAGTINALQRSPDWASTAVILAYDDSDGWYDHVAPPSVNGSRDAAVDDHCAGPVSGGYADRCGFGPRLPLLVISPYSRPNHVDHRRTDQTSVLRFIEDNWRLGRIGDHSFDVRAGSLAGMLDFRHPPHDDRLILDPDTGAVRY